MDDKVECHRCQLTRAEAKIINTFRHALITQRHGAKVTIYISPDGQVDVKESINRGKEAIPA